MNKSILIFLLALLGFALILCLSCNSLKKAQKDVAKISVTHPEVLAKYCADKFPVKEVFLPGDTVIVTDTVKLEGNVITDTLIDFDTVRITRTITLPGKTITKTIAIHDTVVKENTAQLKVCELERSKTLDLLSDANQKLTLSQKRAKTRGIILYSLLGLVILLGAWKIYGMFKPKVKI